MAWFKGDDKAHCNAKLKAAQLDGTGLHFLAISWCSDEETDGFVPDHMLPTLASGLSPAAIKKIVARLTTVHPGQERPLWHEVTGGYQINDYLLHGKSHAELEAKRVAERQRLASKRAQPTEMLTSTFSQPADVLAPC